MTAAGQLRERFRFEAKTADENGDRVGPDWEPLFFARAQVQYKPGNEVLLAQRLEGEQPVSIVIASSRASRALTTDCRAVDHRTGQVWNIKSVMLDERRRWITILAVSRGGGTVG